MFGLQSLSRKLCGKNLASFIIRIQRAQLQNKIFFKESISNKSALTMVTNIIFERYKTFHL